MCKLVSLTAIAITLSCTEGWAQMDFDRDAFDREFRGRAYVTRNDDTNSWEVYLCHGNKDKLLEDVAPVLREAAKVCIFIVDKDREPPSPEGLRALSLLKGLVSISLYQCKAIDDSACEVLGQLSTLRSLQLAGTSITDKGLARLADLGKLHTLTVADTSITDESLRCFNRHPELGWLDISRTAITDHGLSWLARCPQLKTIWAAQTEIGDEGIRHLANLPLERLLLNRTRVTDEGMKLLSTISSLDSLDLNRCQVTNEGIAAIAAGLPNLLHLNLRGTQIDDGCLHDLIRFRKLRSLNLLETAISSDRKAWLSNALPGTGILVPVEKKEP